MKLDNHIALRFLTDDSLAWEIVDTQVPGWTNDEEKGDAFKRAANLYRILSYEKQRAYFITETVLDKLDMLKVEPTSVKYIRKQNSEELGEPVMTYDWSIFHFLKGKKVTFVMPGNKLLRMFVDEHFMSFCHIDYTIEDLKRNKGQIYWCMFWFSLKDDTVCEHWTHKDVKAIEGFIFRLLCFMYLTENEEIIVQPGAKHGTRKSGKIINSLNIPLTIVNSRWNITSVRTEGFDVSGHFRLQPTKTGTKLIFIEPFKKHGYVRRAKSTEE